MRLLRSVALAAALFVAPAIASAQVEPIVGDWYGTLAAGPTKLPLVFHVKADGSASVDSPAQSALGLKATASFADGKARLVLTMPAAAFEGQLSADGKTLAGNWLQGGASLPLSMGRTPPAVAPVKRPQTPKPPFPYRAEEVSYVNPASGLKLAGTLTLPPGQGPFPVAMLITGSGPQDRDETLFEHKPFLVLADALTRKGVAVLRVDDRGVGGSQAGDIKTVTSLDFATDVAAGVAFLRERKDIDPDRVGLIGHSEGGLIAPIVAAKDPRIAFVVLMAGTGVPGAQVMRTQSHDIAVASGAPPAAAEQQAQLIQTASDTVIAEPDPARIKPRLIAALGEKGMPPEAVEAAFGRFASPWFKTFLTLDPAVYLRQVRAPVLALNGDKDTQVSAAQNLPAIKAALADNKDATTLVLPGLNHLFQTATTGAPSEYLEIEETLAPTAIAAVVDWTVAHAAKAPHKHAD
ncbi:alpha/beta hydrolase [Caulobacter sp. D4A]|uniref:alpha/beta hydrolase family protein n=1 Tax=unclassified Caulobacter TaxID=2648921 RepID=UPI000D737574|nr:MULTISPECIES: alpha/beta fold hydrolase [unclassified Caulobacter]PXA87094.1 alpha/beta hydrolase [Caulobacter sp. D4A]PXA95913.1 alpha/beta hydrolase [Caulobacter sp. D5]